MTDSTKGILAALMAYTIWGLGPVFWKAIAHVPPLEVLSHRTFWSLVLFGCYLMWQGRLGELFEALRPGRHLVTIILAAAAVSINWFLYIYAVQIDRVVEASMGYYIMPLVIVGLGYFVLNERLSRLQWAAIGLAVAAVLILTIGLGVAPWISLALAFSFAGYGLIKKRLDLGPVLSVTAEVAIIAPIGLVWLVGVHLAGWQDITARAGGFFGTSIYDSVMLILSAGFTAVPLILFAYASRRVAFSTVGILQYINPSLQFLCAVPLFGETLTAYHLIAFALIWTGLAFYSFGAYRRADALRKATIS
jgi:chloramphenicol-sensitive protein RarD